QAVIQPSLFEGWSTVIEDAKSLNVQVICSNLPVHIEQLSLNGIYFNPYNEMELALIIKGFMKSSDYLIYEDYDERVRRFALNFLSIFSS
ncbi:glycosyltransferase, partial [Algoriphagus lacus]